MGREPTAAATGTRRRFLTAAATAGSLSIAGCLGDDGPPDGTLDFDGFDPAPAESLPKLTRYRTADRSLLSYRRYNAEADRLLILVHGEAFDSQYVAPLAKYLSENAIANVVTPDLRGHGPEPETPGDVGHIDHLREDLRDLNNHLSDIYDQDMPTILAGHGFSAGLALRTGYEPFIEFADGYLLLSPYLGRKAPTTRPHCGGWAIHDEDWLAPLAVLNGFGLTNFNDRTIVEFDVPDQHRDGTETTAYSYRLERSFVPDWDDEDRLIAPDGPIFAIVGANDDAFVPDAYDSVFNSVPESEVRVLDEIGHFGTVTSERSFEAIAEWLAQFERT